MTEGAALTIVAAVAFPIVAAVHRYSNCYGFLYMSHEEAIFSAFTVGVGAVIFEAFVFSLYLALPLL